jgi:hypothetical protein
VILVDTSVWVDHLRGGDRVLAGLLEAGEVLAHPFIIGELALGIYRGAIKLCRGCKTCLKPTLQRIEKSCTSSIGIGSSGWASAMSMLICLRQSA